MGDQAVGAHAWFVAQNKLMEISNELNARLNKLSSWMGKEGDSFRSSSYSRGLLGPRASAGGGAASSSSPFDESAMARSSSLLPPAAPAEGPSSPEARWAYPASPPRPPVSARSAPRARMAASRQ
jgi:hypothetical protein